jgi:hypothetical protein
MRNPDWFKAREPAENKFMIGRDMSLRVHKSASLVTFGRTIPGSEIYDEDWF